MNKSEKFKRMIRGELKPLIFEISKKVHQTDEPVCEFCGKIKNAGFLQDIIDIHEPHGRYPKEGLGMRHPGACDPMNMAPIHRLCHTAHSKGMEVSMVFRMEMNVLSEMMMRHRLFVDTVQWEDLLQATRMAVREYREKYLK